MALKPGPKLWGPSSVSQPDPQAAGPKAYLRNSDYLQSLKLSSQPKMERPRKALRRQLPTHSRACKLKLKQKEFFPCPHTRRS